MQTIQYCPNRTSRVLDIEIEPRQTPSGNWDAECKVYEDVAGVRHLRSASFTLRDIQASSEDDLLDEAATRIADDIEHGRGITL